MTNSVDRNMLQDLVEIMGDDMKLLITSYIQDSLCKLDKFETLDVNAQQDEIYRLAHSLKGSSRNVGAKLFADYCEKIEILARKNTLSSKDYSVKQLRSLFDDAHRDLKEMFL